MDGTEGNCITMAMKIGPCGAHEKSQEGKLSTVLWQHYASDSYHYVVGSWHLCNIILPSS